MWIWALYQAGCAHFSIALFLEGSSGLGWYFCCRPFRVVSIVPCGLWGGLIIRTRIKIPYSLWCYLSKMALEMQIMYRTRLPRICIMHLACLLLIFRHFVSISVKTRCVFTLDYYVWTGWHAAMGIWLDRVARCHGYVVWIGWHAVTGIMVGSGCTP